ncbi:MAG: type II toxin-antitoxin system VapC family toxin [Deltaproteobacteria bacterium]|jgi:predicted nucleic acid-binding protein|nr:type II toxin-antitoxin system VapC family toxin [Deltaproteobacteria bacterium]
MYLLDTDTIIFSLKGHEAIKKNLQKHFEEPMKICVITLMELYFGAYKSEKVTGNLAKIRTIENAFEIISTGRESAEIFGMLKASLEKSGTPLDDFDLIIASCALSHNLILVTNNIKHFDRVEGLRLTNWTVFPV